MIDNHATVFQALAAEYPQLYLNPDVDAQKIYRSVVLRGQEPETTSLDHYVGDCHDQLETVNTPTGEVRVVTLPDNVRVYTVQEVMTILGINT